MLGLIILLPIIGSLFFFGINNEDQTASSSTITKRNSIIKQIGLATSLVTLILTLILFSQMNNNAGGYQFTETTLPFGFLGVDGISIYYVLLTAFITPVALLSNWNDITFKLKYFVFSFLLLETLQLAFFCVADLFMFYIYFESVLIPLFIIVGVWGASRIYINLKIDLTIPLVILGLTLFLIYQFNYNVSVFMLTEKLTQFSFRALDFTFLNYDLIECTALVPWGINLGSALGYYGKTMTKQVRSMYSIIPHYIFSVIIGIILSDGGLRKGTAHAVNCRLSFKQSLAKFEYFWTTYCILAPYISTPFLFLIGQRSGKTTYSLVYYTLSLPCFTELYLLFYPNGVKVLPIELFNWFNPIVLAHLICGDGTATDDGLILCTDSFTIKDTVFLINILMVKYDLDCTLRQKNPGQYRIYIKKNSMDKVRALVLPYMVKSMLYKIHL